MSKYQEFIFKNYHFDSQAKTLTLNYSYDNILNFSEFYTFDFEFVKYDEAALDRAMQLLFFVAGVSYYKAYMPQTIKLEAGLIDNTTADFLNKLYQRGLGEFFYLNGLDPTTKTEFPINNAGLSPMNVDVSAGQLIGLGGGKDSLVSAELLRGQPKVATWSLNHSSQLAPLVERVGLPHLTVARQWDEQLKELNQQDAMNGHVPISAIFSAVGTIVSLLSDYRDTVVSNESSASEPTLVYQDVEINHQYSKSLEYERDYQAYLRHEFGDSPRYYSLLRPLSELRIAELFAKRGFVTYKDVFNSCNKAYTQDQQRMSWCGKCPKCAFVFMILTPFIERSELENLWGGNNLLLDLTLDTTYRQLLGVEGEKPLDCVGEIKESRTAMRLAQSTYPELNKYMFDLPAYYDFRALSDHALPSDILEIVQPKFN